MTHVARDTYPRNAGFEPEQVAVERPASGRCPSGPLLDRIDVHVEVPPVPYRELTRARSEGPPGEESAAIRRRVIRARERQRLRFGRSPMRLEVACTIAALVGAEEIGVKHLAEALQFRVLESG